MELKEEEDEEEKKHIQSMAHQQKCNLVAFYRELKKYKNDIPLQTWNILQKNSDVTTHQTILRGHAH